MKIRKVAGAAVTSVGLVVGMSAFAGATSGTIDNSGNKADNKINVTNTQETELNNENLAGALNLNLQGAQSGNAKVKGNESLGSASTGNASNASNTSTSVSIDNSGSNAAALAGGGAWGSDTVEVHNSGNKANNTVNVKNTETTTVNNTNVAAAINVNAQVAASGNAKVKGNESAGSASTGNVSNSSTTSTTIMVKN